MPLIFSHPCASPYKPAVLPPSLFSKGSLQHLAECCARFTTSNEKQPKAKESKEQQDDTEEERPFHAEHYAHAITSDRARQPYSFAKIGNVFSCIPFVRPTEADEGVQHAFALSNTNIYAWRELFPTPISPFFAEKTQTQQWVTGLSVTTEKNHWHAPKGNFYVGGPPEMTLSVALLTDKQRYYFEFLLDFITKERTLFSLDALGIPSAAMFGFSRSNRLKSWDMSQCLRTYIFYLQAMGVFKKQSDALRCAMEMSHHYLFVQKTPWAESHTLQILEALQVGERLFYSVMHKMANKIEKSSWVLTFIAFDRSPANVQYTQATGALVPWNEKNTTSRSARLHSLLHRIRTLARDFVSEEQRPGDTAEEALRAAIQPLKDIESEKGTRLLLQAIANVCVPKPTALLKDISMITEKEEKKAQLIGLSKSETAVRIHLKCLCNAIAASKINMSFEVVLCHCYHQLCLEFEDSDFNPSLSLARVVQSLMNPHRADADAAVTKFIEKQLTSHSYFVDIVNGGLKQLKVIKSESA